MYIYVYMEGQRTVRDVPQIHIFRKALCASMILLIIGVDFLMTQR